MVDLRSAEEDSTGTFSGFPPFAESVTRFHGVGWAEWACMRDLALQALVVP